MAEVSASVSATEPLDTMVELLSGLDAEGGGGGRAFYDRLCEAMCRLTSMERAGLLLYEEARRIVVPAGNHGFDATTLRVDPGKHLHHRVERHGGRDAR